MDRKCSFKPPRTFIRPNETTPIRRTSTEICPPRRITFTACPPAPMTMSSDFSIRGTAYLLNGLLPVVSISALSFWHGYYWLSIFILASWTVYFLFLHKKIELRSDHVRISSYTPWPVREKIVTYGRVMCLRWDSAVQKIPSRVIIIYVREDGKECKTTLHCSRDEWRRMISTITERKNTVQIIDN